jgi:hypothetical protein
MSWKAGLSRNLPILRFFGCPKSPSSKGVISWYTNNYETIKALNPTMPLLLRTTENAMPAITTELDFTTDDLLQYMIQTNKFQNPDGSTATLRVQAAISYLQTDWHTLRRERWASPGFDPEHPMIDEMDPDWKSDPNKRRDLGKYLEIKEKVDGEMEVFKSGKEDEFVRAENSLLMCQRVDLWCAGEDEAEHAIQHLYALGKRFNSQERFKDEEPFVTEFYPGASDF